jgi:glucan phosphoethanolaminetransferase (alkaline phosphatase superfamily)
MAADDLQERLLEQAREIERLKVKTSTTLTGTEFLTILFVWPLLMGFTCLGIIICWRTLSNPTEVAPELDIILVAFSIFSAPVTAFVATLGQRLISEKKQGSAGGEE